MHFAASRALSRFSSRNAAITLARTLKMTAEAKNNSTKRTITTKLRVHRQRCYAMENGTPQLQKSSDHVRPVGLSPRNGTQSRNTKVVHNSDRSGAVGL